MKKLLNSTAWTQPLWAPPGERGGGNAPQEEGDEGDDFIEGDDDSSSDPLLENHDGDFEDDSDEDPEIRGSKKKDFLTNLFKTDDEEDDAPGEEDDEDAGDSEEAQNALIEDMKKGLAAIQIPEDAIPDDFNPQDPKQLRDVLGGIQRSTAQAVIRIMWKPVEAAMKQTHVRMRQEMRAMTRDGIGENSLRERLNEAIPIAADPAYRQVVKTVVDQTKKKYPGDNAMIVKQTKRALQAMGINTSGSSDSGGNRNRGNGRQNSSAVLDNFARLPDSVFGSSTNRTGDRLKNRLRK